MQAGKTRIFEVSKCGMYVYKHRTHEWETGKSRKGIQGRSREDNEDGSVEALSE